MTELRPITDPPVILEDPAIADSGSARNSRFIPKTKSREALRSAAGVPISSQYEVSTNPNTLALFLRRVGKVSRSTLTTFPNGIDKK